MVKIATWNVNSVKVRKEDVVRWLDREKADILCLQELKVTEENFPFEFFKEAGYECAVAAQKTYNGVAILSKRELSDVVVGLAHLGDDHPLNSQKRLISAKVAGVTVICGYLPNGEAVGSDKYDYKLEFFGQLRAYLDSFFSPSDKICFVGDFNVAPEDIDLYDPDERRGQVIVSDRERAALEEIRSFGFTDCFRLHNKAAGRYSWWDFRGGMYWKGLGMRIDHIWATKPLAKLCKACDIDERPRRWKRPSDHTVVWGDFDI